MYNLLQGGWNMTRKYSWVKYISIIIVSLAICACSQKQIGIVSSPSIAPESLNRDSVQLVWLTDENWVERCMTNERLQAINERIHKLGYNFEVSFQGLSDDSYDEYQKGIDTAKKKGLGDLMWTGYGEEQVEEGTYHRQINQGNLQCLDDWLKTDLGKKRVFAGRMETNYI